ncbi:MAG: hypothetical protein AB1Z98_38925, partial [Nannocystaceae bacterium]
MRARSGTPLTRLVGCALWVVGCSAPTTEVAPVEHEVPTPPLAVQAIHHARQRVSPVLTWRD